MKLFKEADAGKSRMFLFVGTRDLQSVIRRTRRSRLKSSGLRMTPLLKISGLVSRSNFYYTPVVLPRDAGKTGGLESPSPIETTNILAEARLPGADAPTRKPHYYRVESPAGFLNE